MIIISIYIYIYTYIEREREKQVCIHMSQLLVMLGRAWPETGAREVTVLPNHVLSDPLISSQTIVYYIILHHTALYYIIVCYITL